MFAKVQRDECFRLGHPVHGAGESCSISRMLHALCSAPGLVACDPSFRGKQNDSGKSQQRPAEQNIGNTVANEAGNHATLSGGVRRAAQPPPAPLLVLPQAPSTGPAILSCQFAHYITCLPDARESRPSQTSIDMSLHEMQTSAIGILAQITKVRRVEMTAAVHEQFPNPYELLTDHRGHRLSD
eukprot:2816546-Pleurochrysis_carterae.AAC.1